MSPNLSQSTSQRASKTYKDDIKKAAQSYIDKIHKTTPNATREDVLQSFENTFTSIRGAIEQIVGGAATTDRTEKNAGVALVEPKNDSGETLGDDDDELCDYVVVDMTKEW